MEKKKRFCISYAFQVAMYDCLNMFTKKKKVVMYSLWRERNMRHHGDQSMPLPVLIKLMDKTIWNKAQFDAGEKS